jgi:ribonucleotide reductase beta subunit family protein with ferritin-like domain
MSIVPEPLTEISNDRYCLYPIKNTDIFELYTMQSNKIWFVSEIDFTNDYTAWQTLTPEEQEFILLTLAFFANSDNIVIENMHKNFRNEITVSEAQFFFAVQSFIETVHVITYNECIDAVLCKDETKKRLLFKAIETNPIVQPKLEWSKKWIDSNASLGKRLIAFTLVEGVFFSSSFASIFWLRKRRNVPGICFANEKIVEDEALHVLNGAILYRKYIKNKLNTNEIYEMVREAVAIEHKFYEEALPGKLTDMNSADMKLYVCFIADLVLTLLGVPKLYKVQNPFDWMIGIGLVGKANFFEKRVSEYEVPENESKIRDVRFGDLGSSLDF